MHIFMKKIGKLKIKNDKIIPSSELVKLRGGTWLCECAVWRDNDYIGLHTWPCGSYGSTAECDAACGSAWGGACICNWGY
jgi:hypothetical protein